MKKHLPLALATLLLVCRPAFAWGCKGHETVALIAWAHLTPGVAVQVNQILEASPIPPELRRNCSADFPGLPLIANVASWADDYRDGNTGPYHYIDIPLGAPRNAGTIARACNDDCVTFATAKYSHQLTDPAANAQARAEALRFIIHFVGDLQQPLHGVDNADRGGNCVVARLPGADPAARASNLHSIWDSGLLGLIMTDPDPAKFAAALDAQFGNRYAGGSQDPVRWAWESNALAARNVYGPLPVAIARDPEPAVKSCADRKEKLEPEALTPAYVAQATPIIEEQLDKGGRRLANLLNRLLSR